MSSVMKHLFSQSLQGINELHFAAHSHHLWPDVAISAHTRYAFDAATLADDKWNKIFGEVLPEAQGHVAGVLGTSRPEDIAFETNTHNLINRLLSCFPHKDQIRILTTDSEFHSFSRQAQRLEEEGKLVMRRVSTEPFDTFEERFAQAAKEEGCDIDMVFLSHVFFNTGYAVDQIVPLVQSLEIEESAFIVIDGYHGFMALPTDLSPIEDRVFYMAGGYKYAMAGENACFMHCPPGYGPRPANTGWFAGYGALTGKQGGEVAYSENGLRFLGATFDPSGLYRLNAAMKALRENNLTVEKMNDHVMQLQKYFLEILQDRPFFNGAELIPGQDIKSRGRFLTFRSLEAEKMYDALREQGVTTDFRGHNLRFGFGIYHDQDDVLELAKRMVKAGLIKNYISRRGCHPHTLDALVPSER